MQPTVTVRETAPTASHLTASNVRDWSHVRRLLLQALTACAPGSEGHDDVSVPIARLHLLRGFLAAQGAADREGARRLLLLGLLSLEDEDDASRLVAANPLVPIVLPPR